MVAVAVDENELLVAQFEEHRWHLRAVAYRMLGSLADADDAVQDAWLRISHAGTAGVDNLGGWFTRVVARICLDKLRSRRLRAEEPLDARLPDPIVSRPDECGAPRAYARRGPAARPPRSSAGYGRSARRPPPAPLPGIRSP